MNNCFVGSVLKEGYFLVRCLLFDLLRITYFLPLERIDPSRYRRIIKRPYLEKFLRILLALN